MSRGRYGARMGRAGFPRVSGDEPNFKFEVTWDKEFSPRERG